jgi:hypothetical protein
MRIREVEIFLYVNNPDALTDEKLNYISLNEERFRKEIEFYRSLNSSIDEVDASGFNPEELEEHLIKRITLHPVEPILRNGTRFKIAAGSDLLEETDSIKTFMDEQNNFLARVHKSKGKTRLFLFGSEKELIQDFKIVIYPEKLVLDCPDNRSPILLDRPVEIEKIEIQLNPNS